jgi:membrane-associated protease RseP (regulator of RpoE activity)
MPSSHPDSSDSPTPSATRSADAPATAGIAPPALAWRTNAFLFAATVASSFVTIYHDETMSHDVSTREGAMHALEFTAALMAILLAHEFGHFIAARIHKVDASLPFFIPLPILSPFGTMGAVIRMRSVIPTRRALLDIGAAGPLAGLAVAVPVFAWGIAHSRIVPFDGSVEHLELGESLLTRLLEHWFAPPVPDGMGIYLSPMAWAGWAGMFVTMINLFPLGQLDAGHVAYALLGPRQNRIARWVHRSMIAFFFVSVASFVLRDVRAGFGLYRLGTDVMNSISWLVWFEVFAMLGAVSRTRGARDRLGVRMRAFATLALFLLAIALREHGTPLTWLPWFGGVGVLLAMEVRGGALHPASELLDHPPTGTQPLGLGRSVVAVVTLAFFGLLLMVTPFAL